MKSNCRSAPLLILALSVSPAVLSGQTLSDARPVPERSQAVADTGPGALVTPPSDDPRHDDLAPRARALRIDSGITTDGVLDEAAWREAPVIDGFVQREPHQGQPASHRTEVRIVYDEEAIHVGAKMYDHPDSIVGRLARRDADTGSDYILVQFDAYHDHNGDASFSVNPTGTRWDGGNGDLSWNPVWQAETRMVEDGWVVEMRIPFSQLRFNPGADAGWGLQIERYINRLNEIAVWSFWSRTEQGGPSRWGHLSGIRTPASVPGRLELLPYVVASGAANGRVDADDPFAAEHEAAFRAGMDVKYQLTSNLTLSGTLNPDFGQAEVDPAVVNLSAFETFFDEKREFFIEGRDKLGFGGLWCFTCSNASSLSMLHTRRIGRAPQAVALARDAGDFVDAPSATTILGAAKLTGRTAGGWNVGVLNAATAREHADVRLGADAFRQEVEPFTNYFVARVSKDLKDGNLQLGGIATSVVRDFDDDALAQQLNQHSEGIGLDADYWWADRTYHLMAQVAFTNIAGEPEAIDRAQRSSARYYQRPDRDDPELYDPSRTSLQGAGIYARLAREAGDWRWESSLNLRTPGFENNDIAFLTKTDYVWLHGNVNRRFTEPTSWYREANVTFGGQHESNFDGDVTSRQVHLSLYTETPFYWESGLFTMVRPAALDDRKTRGGPVVGKPTEYYASWWFSTDHREPLRLNVEPTRWWAADGASETSLYVGVDWQAAPSVMLSLGPSFGMADSRRQYVAAFQDATASEFHGTRYVFSDLEQTTLSMNARLNWTFTPDMSLELFAQPYFSSNDFSRFKEYARTRDDALRVYGEDVGSVAVVRDDEAGRSYEIDPDAEGPADAFTIDDPDFNFRSLRGNAVFRWEYLPGSTLFVVWTQDRWSEQAMGDFDFARDRRALLNAPSDHVLMLKVSYWMPL